MASTTINLFNSYTNDYHVFNAKDVCHRGFEVEHGEDGDLYILRYSGKQADIAEIVDTHYTGEVGNFGKLKNIRMYQEEGPIWMCELRFESHPEIAGTTPPDTSYGVKSCRLTGGMMMNTLETHPEYRACWNHYLAAAGTTAVPEWWSTATNTVIPGSNHANYRWVRSEAELPNQTVWRLLKQPTMPGVGGYNTSTYIVIETARFRTPSAAGRMVAGVLNKIGTPSQTFGITGGNWKCDGAEVSWRERFWFAKLSWTHSPQGWNTTLYSSSN